MARWERPVDQNHSWGHLEVPDVLAPNSDLSDLPFFKTTLLRYNSYTINPPVYNM